MFIIRWPEAAAMARGQFCQQKVLLTHPKEDRQETVIKVISRRNSVPATIAGRLPLLKAAG